MLLSEMKTKGGFGQCLFPTLSPSNNPFCLLGLPPEHVAPYLRHNHHQLFIIKSGPPALIKLISLNTLVLHGRIRTGLPSVFNMSSSLSSRFSSTSASSNKARSFSAPKPTYNSPKLVRDARLPSSTPIDAPTKVAHPFASGSYTAHRQSLLDLEFPQQHSDQRSRSDSLSSNQAFGAAYTSDFDSDLDGYNDTFLSHTEADTSGLTWQDSLQAETMRRHRSSTVGSRNHQLSEFGALPTLLPSPNPFKSQFDDDSEDEEKLDSAAKALAAVPHRARLAAIGTASRLFKGKRHSRNSSASFTSTPMVRDLPPPLQLSKQRSKELSRPSTSDGMSPLPRQAVFGHRPSPSELSLIPKNDDKTRRLKPLDRDLILGLKGTAPTPRLKLLDKKKSLPKTPEEHAISHHRQASTGVVAPPSTNANGSRVSWIDPPPYCLNQQVELYPSDGLRKSQSLSTLRLDPSRRPSQFSNPTQAPASIKERHAQRSAWETMLSTSPSTISSQRSSLSSCGSITRIETIPDLLPKRNLDKTQRLPPQKPPPQSLPPPPPPLPPKPTLPPALESSQSSVKSSVEVDTPSLTSTGSSASEKQDESPKHSIESIRSTVEFKREHPTDKVELNVRGTKFVTLYTTLLGADGDEPRLIQELSPAKQRADEALCSNTNLIRRQRVDRIRSTWQGINIGFLTADQESFASLGNSNSSNSSLVITSTDRTSVSTEPSTLTQDEIFLDRNPELYQDILDILGNQKLPFRFQAASLFSSSSLHNCDKVEECAVVALKLQFRTRLYGLKEEVEWLGYFSISHLLLKEISLL